MELQQAIQRVEWLRQQIRRHNELYYVQDAPEITDGEYDTLMQELRQLEETYPHLVSEDSPTQVVGGRPDAGKEVELTVPMLSLRDVFSEPDVVRFVDSVKERLGDSVRFIVEPKIDGLSVSLDYRNGSFELGATRGDGRVGENITENLRRVNGVPDHIDHKPRLILRGEVFMPESALLEANRIREENDERLYKNTRNCAAGTLRQGDPQIVEDRKLHLFVFNLQLDEGDPRKSHLETKRFIEGLGFSFCPTYGLYSESSEVLAAIRQIDELRKSLTYGIDGAVVKVDDFHGREILGDTEKYPRWAVAYKYPPEQKQTTVKDIILQVGRTGRITPVALMTPVELAGTTVSRAVLHNQNQIDRLDIRIGDTVVVQKAGDIIPAIVQVVTEKRKAGAVKYTIPLFCPVCGETAEYVDGGADLRCQNLTCPAQRQRRAVFFACKDCMDIDGLGPATVEALIKEGYLEKPSDMYLLHERREELIQSNCIGREKTVDNLLAAIEKSKSRDLPYVIKALGGRIMGERVGKILTKRFGSMEHIVTATLEEVAVLDGIGDKTAKEIIKLFSNQAILEMLYVMEQAGVNMVGQKLAAQGNALEGKVFVITGTLPTLKRAEAKRLIEANGGKVSGSVSKKTSYLLVGEDPGSKLNDATENGVAIITEEELLEMIAD